MACFLGLIRRLQARINSPERPSTTSVNTKAPCHLRRDFTVCSRPATDAPLTSRALVILDAEPILAWFLSLADVLHGVR